MLDLDALPSGLRLRETWDKFRDLSVFPEWAKDLKIGATPSETIFERGNLRLLKYVSSEQVTQASPIIIIPSLINRHYILDLLPGRSLVRFLQSEGFEVFMIEWLPPKGEDRHLSIDRLCEKRVAKALSEVASRSLTGKFHLIGHCLGGTLASIEASLRPERIQSLTLFTAPIDFANSGKLGVWANSQSLDVDGLADAYGSIPWPLMQSAFHLLQPSVGFGKWRKLLKNGKDSKFLLAFLSLELWSNDNISFPGQFYQTLIRDFYRRNALVEGTFQIDGRPIDLNKVNVPLLDVVAVDDHIVPSTMRWPQKVNEGKTTRLDLSGGHIGALLGGRAQKTFWPELSQWLKSQALKTA